MPASQVPVAPAGAQGAPQPPQCSRLVARSASQPLAGSPSQSPKPGVQASITHRPDSQRARALSGAHREPQAPQSVRLICRSTSQPLTASPSQSPNPERQASTVHTPRTQSPSAEAGAQTAPQPPQSDSASRRLISQPLAGSPSQSAMPSTQESTRHRPAEQRPTASAGAHPAPQPPQCSRLFSRSASQPFPGRPSQSAQGARQEPTSQAPDTQSASALAGAQRPPQALQWSMLVSRSVSQPLAAFRSQSPQFVSQAETAHSPSTQSSVA